VEKLTGDFKTFQEEDYHNFKEEQEEKNEKNEEDIERISKKVINQKRFSLICILI